MLHGCLELISVFLFEVSTALASANSRAGSIYRSDSSKFFDLAYIWDSREDCLTEVLMSSREVD